MYHLSIRALITNYRISLPKAIMITKAKVEVSLQENSPTI